MYHTTACTIEDDAWKNTMDEKWPTWHQAIPALSLDSSKKKPQANGSADEPNMGCCWDRSIPSRLQNRLPFPKSPLSARMHAMERVPSFLQTLLRPNIRSAPSRDRWCSRPSPPTYDPRSCRCETCAGVQSILCPPCKHR